MDANPRSPELIDRGAPWKRPLVLAVLVVALIPVFIFLQRYTEVGVFMLGGGSYWVERASSDADPFEAKDHLLRVLGATQYGVDNARNQVNALKNPVDRIRLFEYLIELAPNENWERIYRMEADRHRDQLGLDE